MEPLEALSKWFGPVDYQGVKAVGGLWISQDDLTRNLNYDPFVLENYDYTKVDAEYYLENPGIYLITHPSSNARIRFPFHNAPEPPFRVRLGPNYQTNVRLDISDGIHGLTITPHYEAIPTNEDYEDFEDAWFQATYKVNLRGMANLTNHAFKNREEVLKYYRNWDFYLLHDYHLPWESSILNWAKPPNRFIK